MDKTYDPKAHEGRLYQWWEESGYFKPETQVALGQAAAAARPFVISMPPPNVTGALHMGHGLTAAVEDLMVRYHRLKGEPTLWVPGSDHAGIATQNVVERLLEKEGSSRQALGREAFIAKVWEWKQVFHARITEQHKRLGVSCDWTRERFTLDEGLSQAVQETFVRLSDQGLIYRGTYLVNWCPRCQSVISDIEVEHEEILGKLYEFRYMLEGGGFIPVATTRPETILGDTGVAVHPEDERFKSYVGRTARVPILDRAIPVIADAHADLTFGTGAFKVTPAHDPNDYEIGRRAGLAVINVMNPDGTMNENAGPYAGLDRFEARQRLWADMIDAGLVVGERDHRHSVGHCQRCHTIIEPLLSTQWFVKMRPLADKAMAAVEAGEVRFVPERFAGEFGHWMENIRDWVISRQLWWGHRIPVWYGDDGMAFAGRNLAEAEERARTHFALAAGAPVSLRQDEDVLDTWFSSGLWPFSTLGWPEATEDLARFYPTSVLETGYDILFFWVARMIMMGLELTGEAPFHTVYLHGLVRDAQGRKMSKSLANVVDPIESIELYGCDALRFTLVTGSTPGIDMKLTDERLEGSRNFANKLWNVGRFILSNLDTSSAGTAESADPADGESLGAPKFQPEPYATLEERWDDLDLSDRWILAAQNTLIKSLDRLCDSHQYGEAGRQLYDFLWRDLADWYVEAAKVNLYGAEAKRAETTRQVLYHVLERSLTLLHPFMPFVTEAIWQHLPKLEGAAPALIVSCWPAAGRVDEASQTDFGLLQELVRGVRNARAEYEVEPGRRIPATLSAGSRAELLESQRLLLCQLARLEPQRLVIEASPRPPTEAHATVVVGEGVEAWLPLAGMIDLEKERTRLTESRTATAAEVARLQGVLANESFTGRAPENVVQRERDRLVEAEGRLAALEERLRALQPAE